MAPDADVSMKYLRAARFEFHRLFTTQAILHCVGDSHIESFAYLAKEYLLPRTCIQFCIVQGATTMGLANPHSQTQALPIFMEYLDKVGAADHVVFCLGEVDCGFVIWYRAEKYGTPIKSQFDLSLANYFDLIDAYLNRGNTGRIMVCSTPLPSIPDSAAVSGEVANKRLSICASLKQRTDLTIDYNDRLREFCKSRGIGFLDLLRDTLDKDTGVVSQRFLNKNPLDHHLEPEQIAKLIVPQLNRFGLR